MRLPLFGLLALLLTGCPPPPVVQLVSMRVARPSQYGLEMAMVLRVNNANPFDVKVRNVRAQVTVADKFALPYVRFNPDMWMPANSWSFVTVPATIPWATIAPLAATTVGNDTIGYHVSGYVDVTATRLLGIAVNDHEIDADDSVSRADIVFAAMRGAVPGAMPGAMPGGAPGQPPPAGPLLAPKPPAPALLAPR